MHGIKSFSHIYELGTWLGFFGEMRSLQVSFSFTVCICELKRRKHLTSFITNLIDLLYDSHIFKFRFSCF